uniref:YCII-related domain-containing protein n=1 Tax=Amorphochlora amoebiformis TaxID=1561963 RepID=A0A7S0DTJ3_9EUKA
MSGLITIAIVALSVGSMVSMMSGSGLDLMGSGIGVGIRSSIRPTSMASRTSWRSMNVAGKRGCDVEALRGTIQRGSAFSFRKPSRISMFAESPEDAKVDTQIISTEDETQKPGARGEGGQAESEAGGESESDSASEQSAPLPSQRLFAVIEMAESANAVPSALEDSPSLKEEQDAYLKDLMEKGLIVSSGSFESQEALTGVWIVKADSLDSALKIRDNSPYWKSGIIPNTIVRQWNAVGELLTTDTSDKLDEAVNELNQLKDIRAAEAAKAEQYAAQVAKVQDAYTRVMNDFQAYKKRSDKEKEMAKTDGKGAALRKLLGMIDNFAYIFDAVDPQTDGEKEIDFAYRSLYDQMIDIFKTEGLEEIGAVGEQFDFEYHEAVESIPTSEHPDGTILKVTRPGFKIDGKLVRAAHVEVASNPDG